MYKPSYDTEGNLVGAIHPTIGIIPRDNQNRDFRKFRQWLSTQGLTLVQWAASYPYDATLNARSKRRSKYERQARLKAIKKLAVAVNDVDVANDVQSELNNLQRKVIQ